MNSWSISLRGVSRLRAGDVTSSAGDCGRLGVMEKLPEELRLLVVERMSPIEDLANLRLVSRA